MDVLEWLQDKFSDIADALFEVMPQSPILYLVSNGEINQVLSYINWFIPIYSWMAILENWLVCILVYYALQFVLRWIKFIE